MKSVLLALKAFIGACLFTLFDLVTRHMYRHGLILGLDYYFPEGSKLYYSTTFAAAKTITALSNANPALATSVGHGYVDGDIVLLTSGWEDANNMVYKVDQQSVDTFQLLDLDSSDTDWFAAGTGTGTAQLVSSWVEVPGILTLTTSGGDPRYTTVGLLARRNDDVVPTGFNAVQMSGAMVWDPADATYIAMKGITKTLTKVALKMVTSGGAVEYGYGNLAVGNVPQRQRNQVNQVAIAVAVKNQFTSYTS